MSRRVPLFVLLVALALLSFAPSAVAADTTVDAAVAFLTAQQRADGGFGASEPGFPGFETPDAVLAIASAAQSGSAWSDAEALAAVQAVQTGGKSGLSYLDDYADGVLGPLGAGPAARLVIVAERLGLDPTAFDPEGDGATDLVAVMQSGLQPDGSFGAFNTTLTAIVAYRAAGLTLPAATLPYVEAAQQPNGSWDFVGDPTGSETDPDTTGLALTALVAEGRDWSSPVVQKALAFLAGAQNDDGTWSDAFGGGGNPSSTANVVLGIAAVGFDPASQCWRDLAVPADAAEPYASPDAAVRALQAGDGHIASPYDEWGLNTLGTSQALVALLRNALPFVRAEPPACPQPVATATTTSSTPATTAAPASGSTTSTPVTVAGGGSTPSTTRSAAWAGAELPRTGGAGPAAALGIAVLSVGAAMLAFAASSRRGRAVR